MTRTMEGMIKKARNKILDRYKAGGKLVFEVGNQPTHHAMTLAWVSVSLSQRYHAPWRGPGKYELSGNVLDGATVTKVAEPTQLTLNL